MIFFKSYISFQKLRCLKNYAKLREISRQTFLRKGIQICPDYFKKLNKFLNDHFKIE